MGYAEQITIGAFWETRRYTEQLCANLSAEDQCVQSMPDASPAKWHRAHSTWFFEQFLLIPYLDDYQPFSPDFSYLFNSYYEAVGERHPRFARGMITRPGTDEVTAYRKHVDKGVASLLGRGEQFGKLVELGMQHEQQHQELLLTDILHAFSLNPLKPSVIPSWKAPHRGSGRERFIEHRGGIVPVGHESAGFAFDNEGPRHEVLLRPFAIGSSVVRNAAWLQFMEDGGYRRPTLWMSEGWATALSEGWCSPAYWREASAGWVSFGPAGEEPIDVEAPVRHVSWYEADAFSRWAGCRMPTEFEWEAANNDPDFCQRDDQVWQWTASAYLPYPGFKPVEGAIGEYNGKFMINQMVLRGGSMATPPGHTRSTYRNFFHPDRRWQFTGLRLAKDI